MENRRIFIYIAMVFIISSCGNFKNPKVRNKLVFKDDIEIVKDSILEFGKLMKNFDNRYLYIIERGDFEDYSYKNYRLFLDNDNLKSIEIGYLTDTNLYKRINSVNKINNPKRFVSLVLFLEKNQLNSARKINGKLFFSYRSHFYMADRQKDLIRYVVLVKDIRDIDLNKYKVLDNKGSLFLLADKDAEIWEN
jgi:hypothetical protein